MNKTSETSTVKPARHAPENGPGRVAAGYV